MHSAIYQGFVRHRRFQPHTHRFSYRVFMMYLDLDELDQVLALSPLWSRARFRPARFQRSDFLGDPEVPLKQAVCDRIHAQTGIRHEGSVRLLANLRYFGFNINPIACYYCFDRQESLRFIVAEVTNTPWGERQSYVLRCDPQQRFQRIEFDKQMHVSPFNPMDMRYRWCSNRPQKMLTLNLETECDSETHVDATMALRRREITSGALAKVLLQYPWMTGKVAFAIYWQALKLWFKRNPIYDHPRSSEPLQQDQSTIDQMKSKI
jgi:uncharacterized protein